MREKGQKLKKKKNTAIKPLLSLRVMQQSEQIRTKPDPDQLNECFLLFILMHPSN